MKVAGRYTILRTVSCVAVWQKRMRWLQEAAAATILDLADSESLVQCADNTDTLSSNLGLGPYIAVFKTHVDLVADFGDEPIRGLKELPEKHNFLIFEDRKLVDIGNTVQKQYHGGVLRLSEWADIVNLSILGGDGIVEALDRVMTSKGSIATGSYTQKCFDIALKFPRSMIGFVATRALGEAQPGQNEDFLVFTTGVNLASKGDKLGQQYQTPTSAVEHEADFIIAGRGIYASANPVEAAKQYQAEGWAACLKRTQV
ncbi:humps family-domain-containing protein [Lasiosphaeria miniovina]|uniref:Orotidine 5'-phosphate decarboxylase n=1 Tax=Lasiosphaeria miniovina TaxID=1954250 RepID=A0AA40EE98_9PEZI|nr:humps family-domain-containing protein [Lasiosphaeria miniovina]KAK0734271.1 humps family-domain-containing protein [Lasiosphaeria miniovina]